MSAFHKAYASATGYPLDAEKRAVVDPSRMQALHVVAGPGTGKTTSLVARILKLIVVDRTPPTGIVATTFTTKAAAELRSRLIEVGFPLVDELLKQSLAKSDRDWVEAIDINQVLTGTTDSLCQDLLTQYRPAGQSLPVVADEFVTKTVMMNEAVFASRRWLDADLLTTLANAMGHPVTRPVDMQRALMSIADRQRHDELDLLRYTKSGPTRERAGRKALVAALDAYATGLAGKGLVDYAGVETETLLRLRAGALSAFTANLSAVLVDEYQDTNLLQEQLYLELAGACGGAITVVGDDDQSLYRFRGATVELFTGFPSRARAALGTTPRTEFLTSNYRSTGTIVDFVNEFAANDADYQPARSAKKPVLVAAKASKTELPIMAMFRPTAADLANDLAAMLYDIFRGTGFRVGSDVIRQGVGGDIGDAALLTYSPKEDDPTRLVPLLRGELGARGLQMFNPRGQETPAIPTVATLGGLALEALDPTRVIENSVFRPNNVRAAFDSWRTQSRAAMSANAGLARVVASWQGREADAHWESRTPFLELLYACAQALPGVLDDPEEQLFVELIARQVNAAEQVSTYSGRILLNRNGNSRAGNPLGDASVKDLIKNVLVQVAMGTVTVNEDLISDFPHDRLPVLSIHQSKGLEFPLTIVDVGSRFRTNHRTQARFRFPASGEEPQALEDTFRPFSPLGRPTRGALDRAFDDLIRQYFVAFSRARHALLLVGLDTARPGGRIPNVALGWDRQGTDLWQANLPFTEI